MNPNQRLFNSMASVLVLAASMTFPGFTCAQSPSVTLWNKLDGGAVVVASEVGPSLNYYDPSVDGPGEIGNLQFVPGKFGAAATLGAGHYYSTARVRALVLRDLRSVLNPERGTIAVWYKEKERPVPYQHNNYLIFGGGFDLFPPVQFLNSYDGVNPSTLKFYISFGGERSIVDALFSPPLNEWVHVAAVWDRNGIKGTPETVRLYVNGTRVSAITANTWGHGYDDNNVDILGGNDFIQERFALDNLVIYSDAKTDFADRFNEDPQAPGPVATTWVRASTTDQIVDAMSKAGRTGTPTSIRVAAGRYFFLRSSATSPPSGVLPAVSTSMRIVGEDAATTSFESDFDGHIFTVTRGGSLKVSNLTITRGGGDLDGGGAAVNYQGFLRFDRCRIVGNGAGRTDGARGGALLSVDARLHLEDTQLTDNSVDGNGGAMALIGGSAILKRVTIRDNRANAYPFGGQGGGIYASKATMTVMDSTIADNVSGDISGLTFNGYGGGVFSDGTLWMTNSAVISNAALGNAEGTGRGGGIANYGVMSIKNSTVAANYAGVFGGGIFNRGKLTLQGVTVTANETDGIQFGCDGVSATPCSGGGGLWNEGSGSIRAVRSVFAANRIRPYGFPYSSGPDCAGLMSSDGRNAFGDSSGCLLRPSWALRGQPTNDQVDIDPRLGELLDSGEAGSAHVPLLAESPLIDSGGVISNTCTGLDQIGQSRKDGNGDRKLGCDIGAIEYQAP